MSCFQVLRRGSPECKAIIIILIRSCLLLFAKKNAVDGIFFLSECKYTINPAGDKE
ncbi:hypothetical protein SEEHN189_14263 [Salmonella enterica subsp. enterica serovar Heidelberg str. N189]|nr:Hypothetical protein FORC30_0304 [Salmonella enterica]EYH93413.1 hypothetical protein SEEHN189_14263 [Salmonella enterica subsp. enterica serovar Heidelberg str. N189]